MTEHGNSRDHDRLACESHWSSEAIGPGTTRRYLAVEASRLSTRPTWQTPWLPTLHCLRPLTTTAEHAIAKVIEQPDPIDRAKLWRLQRVHNIN